MRRGNQAVRLTFCILLGGLMAIPGSVGAHLQDGLQGWFDFEKTSLLPGTNVHGTPGGRLEIVSDDSPQTLTFNYGGRRATAINFMDKTGDALRASELDAFYLDAGTGELTVSLWFNLSSSTGAQALVQCGNRTERMTGYSVFYKQTGQILARVADEQGIGRSTDPMIWREGPRVNTWRHVVLVISRATQTLKLYVDGSGRFSEISLRDLGSISNISHPVSFGGVLNSRSTDFSLSGRLDNIGVWNRALNEAEVAELFNNGDGTTPFQPMAASSAFSTELKVASEPGANHPEALVVEENGLRIRVGETIKIAPENATHCAWAGAIRLSNGDLIVTIPWPRTGQPILSLRSKDGGKSWTPSVSALSYDGGETWTEGPTPLAENFLVLDNGEIIGFDFPERRSHVWTFTPDATRGILRPTIIEGPEDPAWFAYQHTLTQLDDGRILATSQARIDINKEVKWWIPIHVSEDRGLTWRYYSTAAKHLFSSHRQEGFSEPRLLKLPNGNLLCFLRTANPDTARRNGYTYTGLEVTRSTDMGASWSAPVPVADFGVYPDAVVLENGVVAVSYGRPGNWVAFSKDHGNNWICELNVADTIRAPDCGHYNSLIEVEPNVLMLVYSTGVVRNAPTAEILGTFLHVDRIE